VPVNQFSAALKALSGQQAPALAELKPQLLRQRTAHAVRALLDVWSSAARGTATETDSWRKPGA